MLHLIGIFLGILIIVGLVALTLCVVGFIKYVIKEYIMGDGNE